MKFTLIITFLTYCLLILINSTFAGYTSVIHVNAAGASSAVENRYVGGFWRKKMQWKARWVKSWQEKRIYVPLWKRVWGPVEVKEWVPLPKPPPGW